MKIRTNRLSILEKYWIPSRNAFLSDGSKSLENVGFVLFLLFVVTVPLLYGLDPEPRDAIGGGSVMPAGTMFLEVFAFLLAAVAFFSRSGGRARLPAAPLVAIGGVAVLGIVQLVPLPQAILERIAPTNLLIYRQTAEIFSLFGAKGSPAPRISIAAGETAGAVLITFAYLALLAVGAALLRNRMKRRLFRAILIGAAALQILLVLIRESMEDRVHGTFVNPDQLAGYLEIALAFAFGSLWSEVLTGADRMRDAGDGGERFEKRFVPLALRVLVWAVVAVAIGLTQSRGGILAAVVTTLVLLAMAVSHRPRTVEVHRRATVAVALAVLAGIVFVAATAGARPFLRFLQLNPRYLGGNARVDLWTTSIRAWQEFPLVGSGLGTFREAFRRVQLREFPGLVEHAHSDLLQLLVTGGAIGAAFGVIVCGSLFVLLARLWRKQKHREESAVVLAGFGALLSLTLHGVVDFNLSIPAITATLACALGAACAAGQES